MLSRLFGRRSSAGAKQERQPLTQQDDGALVTAEEAQERERFRELLASRMEESQRQPQQQLQSRSGPSRPILLTIVRSAVWQGGNGEDQWQVEVQEGETVADVKRKIAELYEVPAPFQRLQSSDVEGIPGFEDSVGIDALLSCGGRIYLHPEESGVDTMAPAVDPATLAMEHILQEEFQTRQVYMQERAEALAALAASLQGVTYTVRFLRPESAGGTAAGRTVTLTLDAMALVGDVQAMVEVELFGKIQDDEAVVLTLEGVPLPLHVPLHFAGVSGDGMTVVVASEVIAEDEGDGGFDRAVRRWACEEEEVEPGYHPGAASSASL